MSKIYEIKNRLRMCRKSCGFTQEEVAKIMNIGSAEKISRWERGERLPNLIEILRFSALYKRLVNDLFFDLYQEQRELVTQRLKKLKEEKNVHLDSP